MNLGDDIIQGREKNIMLPTERKVNQNKGARQDYSIVRWYALTHLDPDALKRRIDEVNSQLKRSGSNTWYDYFIPYSFIRQRFLPKETSEEFQGNFSEKDVKDNNRIRNILHRFVFIKATGHDVKRLLDSDWNKRSWIKLQPYAATADDMRYVPDTMMDSFMSACYDQREKFELTPFIQEVGVGADVIISEGKFKSAKAKVKEVFVKEDGLRLTLSVELFANSLDITLYDYSADDVVLSSDDSKFISVSYADYIEQLLLDILSRRVNHKETNESHQADLHTLSMIWRYRPSGVDDPYLHARVMALSLICARLRFDASAQQVLLPQVASLLAKHQGHAVTQKNALAMAMLHIALYIATKSPTHRVEARALVAQFTEEGHPFRRFISLIRR